LEHLETNAERLEAMAAQLNERSLPEVDFDLLRQTLTRVAAQDRTAEMLTSELAVLREDYVARIAGMTKAVAVVERNQSGLAEALEYLESLASLDANGLVTQYRRAAARFRDAFPTSFGNLRPARRKLEEPEQYK